MLRLPRRPRWLLAAACVPALLALAPGASAQSLQWADCGTPVQCATQTVPLDYDRPGGRTIDIAVARMPATDQAHRIGSLFVNPGGPGASAIDFMVGAGAEGLFAALNERFDIVAFDPRGVGHSSPSIDCKINQETQGLYSQPFPTPFNVDPRGLLLKDLRYVQRCQALNGDILAHVSTADVARDMDGLRKAVGDDKLSYLGFSYGTFLGATYASLFPNRFRALVLDGPVDADEFVNDPVKGSNEQTAAFERELGRFFQACANNQEACLGFGTQADGVDPWDAYDQLVDSANASPIPADGYTPDPRPVDGDDLNAMSVVAMYNKLNWPILALALAAASPPINDGTLVRAIVDEVFYGRNPDTGEYDPGSDRFVAIYASEGRWPRDIGTYLHEGDQAFGMFDHFYSNHGYSELNFGVWPVRARDSYNGPFRVRASAPTPLVVATTYDPATPYRGALKLVRELGNARLLTMRGDGHTAYGGNSACIDAAVNAYLIDRALPPAGTTCRQQIPFQQETATAQAQAKATRKAIVRTFRSNLRGTPVTP